MRAKDVMVRDVVTASPDMGVADAIELLAEHDVSALPVVDDDDRLVGVVSEADLIRRGEIDTIKHRPWWLEAITPATTLAEEFAKSHGRRIAEVMSAPFVAYGVEAGLRYSDAAVVEARLKRVEADLDAALQGLDRRTVIPFNRMVEWGADGRIVPGAPVHSPFIRRRRRLELE